MTSKRRESARGSPYIDVYGEWATMMKAEDLALDTRMCPSSRMLGEILAVIPGYDEPGLDAYRAP